MINRTNRAIASVLAFFLVFSLVFAPALTASADDLSATSAELLLSTDGMDISAKLAVDADTGLALLAAMGSEGETFMDLGLFVTTAGLILQSNPVLDQAYGIDLSKVAENLPKSVLAPDSGSSLALDQASFDAIMSFLQPSAETAPVISMDMDVVMGAVMAYVNFIEQHSEEVTAALMGSAELNMAPTTLNILDQDVEVSLTTITFGPQALTAFFKTLTSEIAADSELLDSLAALFKELAGAGVEVDPAEVAGENGAAVLGQILTETGDQLEQIITEADLSVIVNLATDKTSGDPVCVAASVKMGEQEVNVAIVILDNTYGVALRADDTDFGAYLVIEDMSDTGFSAYITTQADGSEIGRLSLNLDFATGAYTLGITSNGETVTATGTVSSTEDGGVMITLETMDGQEFPGTLALVMRNADVISVPAFAELLTMSEEELMTLVQNVLPMVQDLASSFGIA